MDRIGKLRFSTDNWPCLGNGERYGEGYY